MPDTKAILIIEDETTIVDFMTEALQDEGYTVRSASNCAHGLNEIATALPALVLLDLHMPGMPIGEFLGQVHTDGASLMPIIIITADQRAPAHLSHYTGITYLFKPFDLDELLKCVLRFVPLSFTRER